MFEDDTSIYHGNFLPSRSLQNDLNNALNCFYTNKLTDNATRCGMISFGTGKYPAICMNQMSIEYLDSCKYLDFHLGGRLKFVHHIYYVLRKLKNF